MIPTTVKVVSAASRRAFLSTRATIGVGSRGRIAGGAVPPFPRQPQQQPRNDRGLYFSSFSRCLPVLDRVSVNVPTMGDSITEGTIVEWTAQVGQAVNEGDVVALVETDKVTVDIKAEMAGVVVAHFGEVDDTVEVGAALYEIDTEGVADAAPSASDAGEATKEADPAGAPPPASAPAPAPTPAAVATTAVPAAAANAGGGRKPMIRFLGKEGWALRLSGASASGGDADGREVYVQLIPDDPSWDPMYGRPPFSEEEMEALLLGGASAAPKIIKPSSGAIFA